MTQTANAPISDLRSSMHGEVVEAGDATYDEARRVWNAAIDRRPLAVARCADESDVQAAVRFAAMQRRRGRRALRGPQHVGLVRRRRRPRHRPQPRWTTSTSTRTRGG